MLRHLRLVLCGAVSMAGMIAPVAWAEEPALSVEQQAAQNANDNPSLERQDAEEGQATDQGVGQEPFEYMCESKGFNYKYCPSPMPIEQVTIGQVFSTSACTYGSTWGYDRNGVWVKEGCRASFIVSPAKPPPEPATAYITCSSSQFRFASCDTGLLIGSVQLVKRHSRAGCDAGRDWGHNGQSIWVNDGCRATFFVQGHRR